MEKKTIFVIGIIDEEVDWTNTLYDVRLASTRERAEEIKAELEKTWKKRGVEIFERNLDEL